MTRILIENQKLMTRLMKFQIRMRTALKIAIEAIYVSF